jgi:hypothetical protein
VLVKWSGKPPFHQLNQNLHRNNATFDRMLLCPIRMGRPPFFNNSGLYSAWFACEWLRAKTLYLYGIDFFRPVPGRLNDKGKPTNDIYGINTLNGGNEKCWEMLHKAYPHVELVRVGPIIESDREFYANTISKFMTVSESIE